MLLGSFKDGQNLGVSNEVAKDLIEKYGKFIWDFINKFSAKYNFKKISVDNEDLYQIGCSLMMLAWQNYLPDRDVKFHTYLARYLINGFMKIGKETHVEQCQFQVNMGECWNYSGKTTDNSTFLTSKNLPVNYYKDPSIVKLKVAFDKAVVSLYNEKHLTVNDRQFINLRLSGAGFQQIGKVFGYTCQRAQQRWVIIQDKIQRRLRLMGEIGNNNND